MAETKKYLDLTGLTNLVNSIKNLFSKSVAVPCEERKFKFIKLLFRLQNNNLIKKLNN